MKISVDYELHNCSDCPYLRGGMTFGNDGRDGSRVYICSKGVFGGLGDDGFGYDTGLYSIPKVPPYGCPYIKSEAIDRVASRLGISTGLLADILSKECVKLTDK